MNKRKIAAIILATMITNLSATTIDVLAQELNTKNNSKVEVSHDDESHQARVSKFDLYNSDKLDAYNQEFQVSRSNIKSINNNGGKYNSSTIDKAIDGNLETHWETGKPNDANFTNEVVVTFNEITNIDRIVYSARRDSARGKGFAKEFEIYASLKDEGDDFNLVSSGEYTESTRDLVEIKFNPTDFKRLKFKFKKADQNWASAAEFMFYKEDKLNEKFNGLFTDSSMNKVSEEFNTLEKLNAFENELKDHPIYDLYKEGLNNARAILTETSENPTKATLGQITYNLNDDYNNQYRMPYKNIKAIKNNGRHYAAQNIEKAIDNDVNTYWETGTLNSSSFNNEVEVEFNDLVTLDRIVYGSRQSDLKGFAEEVYIYASRTSKGDTYKLVATGAHEATKGLVEAKFEPTEFKRVKFKFKKSKQNSATLNELMFYKPDEVYSSIPKLFTDGTMSELSEEFNSLEKINAFKEKAKNHPLYNDFNETIELAESLISNPRKEDVLELEMRGDSISEAKKRKVWNFQDWQITGLSARAGDKITVYVDVAEGDPTPTLLYKQSLTQHGGATSFQLKPGKNEITIPEINYESNGIPKDVIQGGDLFFTNYKSDSQKRAPKVRIEGASKYPVFILGKSDENEVMKELEAYVEKIKAEPKTTPNIFAVSSNKSLEFVQATYALDWYKKNNKTPKYTAEQWDQYIADAMGFWGFDNSKDVNSDFNFRIMPMVKNLSGGAFMNAGNGVIGIRPGNQDAILAANKGWGVAHELGHNFDTGGRTIVEVTNNMMPLFFESKYKTKTRITDQNIWENNTYPKVGLDDYSNNELYNKADSTHLAQLAPLWQLYLYDNTFYGKFERQFRERDFGNKNREDIYKSWVVAASDAMELDLTEFFARHGIRVDDKVKEDLAKYPKPDKKIYYLNDLAMNYKGDGFTENAKVSVSTSGSNGNIKLSFSVDDENKDNILGYEIRRDGKYVGFTSNDSFVDTKSNLDEDGVYVVTPYDRKLNTLNPIEVNALQPTLSVNPVITLALGEEFNEEEYIVAKDIKGNSLSESVKVKSSNVNTSKVGEYEVLYSLEDSKGNEYTKTSKVNVVSRKEYMSDLTPKQSSNGWGTVRKDKSISGGVIGLTRDGDFVDYNKGLGLHSNAEYVYDLEGKDYDYFESYVGVDKAMSSRPASSVIFKVLVDGEEKFNSGVMRSTTPQKYVKVDVKNAKELKLIVNDAGDGDSSDHASFGDAKLATLSSKPIIKGENLAYSMDEKVDLMEGITATDIEDGNITSKIQIKSSDFVEGKSGIFTVVYSVTDSDGLTSECSRTIAVTDKETQLSDLNWKSATIGSGSVRKDRAVSGNQIRLLNEDNSVETFAKGIGTHSYSEIVYNSEGYDIFDTWVGIDRHVADKKVSSVKFKVYVDGELKAETDVMRIDTPKKRLVVDVRNSKEIKLVVDVADNGNTWDHADWADAKFRNLAEYDTTELNKALEEAKKLDLNNYTEESSEALKNAISKGEEALLSKDKETINSALEELNKAMDSLVKVDLNAVINIPDKYLLKSIQNQLNKTGDITLGDMYSLTTLTLSGVVDLSGLENAKNLETLNMDYNEVKDLRPLSKLKKLNTLNAQEQFIAAGELKPSNGKVIGDSKVYNREGKNVAKTIRVVDKNGNTILEQDAKDEFTINTKDLSSGLYGVHVLFEDEGFSGVMFYLFNV
ncbi:NPCBM/NEW2 domain-containing protein [Clostridium perfringens]|uniref:NPCBM/NEW2 domain-containing protein n=1 Tax=Clostridium perfringens TaxID=1502 RepID=UPI0013E3218B|nr:NPCBM/NEW2 domain-containing protein [Clostridium perfringens]MDJ8931592.1 NPCBM/NEW2 domain-containing protein [Clostridium perfringens]MDJ8937352.1 NPCBM/NEW2 domain-containing protein [Clostridium perfringens]MDJ8940325.1 NPCBM/NEW2 domain-containing protein [Clostridium perfringens]MDM0720605.1 NPCBM/NEW2 domain-containing protein [Clostridium perfringens]MDM0723671.1 NPCBM/NEW2 domain-containing protein [Clostridium perfringens]